MCRTNSLTMLLKIFLLFSILHESALIKLCVPTKMQDIQDAATISDFAYKESVTVGDPVPGAPGYKVESVISVNYLGRSLRALVITSYWTTVIAFRGTVGSVQLLTEGIQGHFLAPVEMEIANRKVHVMRYWKNAFEKLNLHNTIKLKWFRKYIITGHSLGGALASLFSVALSQGRWGWNALWSNPTSRLITFGQPRVGLPDYAQLHDELIPPFKKLRIVNRIDVVPNWPFNTQEYTHASRLVWIVDLPLSNTWVICGDKEGCYNKDIAYDPRYHSMEYYLASTIDFGKSSVKKWAFMVAQCT